MELYTAKLEQSGRLLIPAPVRRQLGLEEGSELILRVEDNGEIRLSSRALALAHAQNQLRRYVPAGRSLAKELIAERQAEAERENSH